MPDTTMPPPLKRDRRVFGETEIVTQLHDLGVKPGTVLQVHSSFRAVRPVAGGPRGLIRALCAAVGPGGTVVMPSWTGDDDSPFNPEMTPADADLGVVANMFWQCPEVKRSRHPFAWAAWGAAAGRIVDGSLPLPPHRPDSPVGRIFDLDGQVLLLGVNHDADTTLHLAELLAGVPYRMPRHCTVLRHGRAHRIDYGENDHCCERFVMVDDWLRDRGLQAEGDVGHARARLLRSRDVVRVAGEYLSRDPLIFLHPRAAGCAECNVARQSLKP